MEKWGRPKGISQTKEAKEKIGKKIRAWHLAHKAEHSAAVRAGILRARMKGEEL